MGCHDAVCINGEVLINKLTGVEKYLYEILKEIDVQIPAHNLKIYLLLPSGVQMENDFPFKNIILQYLPIESEKSNEIDRKEIRRFVRDKKALYVNMSGGRAINGNSIICVHDIRRILFREYDSFVLRFKAYVLLLINKIMKAKFVTVSDTVRGELSRFLHINSEKISVIGNAWEHIEDLDEDLSFWKRHPELEKGNYYYSLSSDFPHKNFVWIKKAAERNKDSLFVIAGKSENAGTVQGNVIYLGYVTDEENKTLLKNAKAFIHPTKYEGFGITPVEALACGTKVLCSDIPIMHEVLEDAAVYFDPDDYEVDISDLISAPTKDEERVLKKYSWEKSAGLWIELFEKTLKAD